MSISIYDRTFDDERFITLSKKVHDDVDTSCVSRVVFGTGPNTTGTPPRWPGITDSTVDLLLQWPDITMLIVEGTEITAEGRKRLLSLQKLDDLSQKNLSQD